MKAVCLRSQRALAEVTLAILASEDPVPWPHPQSCPRLDPTVLSSFPVVVRLLGFTC